MSEMLERADKWIAGSGDDTEELQEAAVVITALKEAYLKYFNLHHTLAVNEAGIKGILCDALKIEHYQHNLYELSQMVTEKQKDLEFAYKRSKVLADLLEIPVHESPEVTGTILGLVRGSVERLQGTLNDIMADLQGRNIHLLSKHCWCGPTGHPWTQKGTVAE